MKVGLIGAGRMGKVLAGLLKSHSEITLYDRNSKSAVNIASKLGLNYAGNIRELLNMDAVILAIPDREIISCINEFVTMNHKINLISIATNIDQETINKTATDLVRCIGVKFIGQADEISAGDAPVIVINHSPHELIRIAKRLFQPIGEIMIGEADMVAKINTIAARNAIEAAVKIEKELRSLGYTQDTLIHTAIRQIGAGILKAYSYHNLGPFAREIEKEVRSNLERKEWGSS